MRSGAVGGPWQLVEVTADQRRDGRGIIEPGQVAGPGEGKVGSGGGPRCTRSTGGPDPASITRALSTGTPIGANRSLSSRPGLPESLSALLVSESCNVGRTPVADQTHPPLTRERLNGVGHNYLRSATHAAASTRLAGYHTPLPLAQAWGGGEMASADGMRFVIPVSTIHAACNPRYFGRQRGSTLYAWMAGTHTVFAQRLIPGTRRDGLHVLDRLLANQTGIGNLTKSPTAPTSARRLIIEAAFTRSDTASPVSHSTSARSAPQSSPARLQADSCGLCCGPSGCPVSRHVW